MEWYEQKDDKIGDNFKKPVLNFILFLHKLDYFTLSKHFLYLILNEYYINFITS